MGLPVLQKDLRSAAGKSAAGNEKSIAGNEILKQYSSLCRIARNAISMQRSGDVFVDIQIRDPDTVLLIHDYIRYLSQVDGVKGTADQIAESMVLGFIDEHAQFRSWRRTQAQALR